MYVTVSPRRHHRLRYDAAIPTAAAGTLDPRPLYRPGGISRGDRARTASGRAQAVPQGRILPALESSATSCRVDAIETFGAAMDDVAVPAVRWADSYARQRKRIIDQDVLPVLQNRLLDRKSRPKTCRAHSATKVKERGAPATAVQIGDIARSGFIAVSRHRPWREALATPADKRWDASSIATADAGSADRALSPLPDPAVRGGNRWNRWRPIRPSSSRCAADPADAGAPRSELIQATLG